MYFESKVLNVELKRAKIHYVPDVVYSQVSTFEKPVQPLQMDLLIPAVNKRLPAVIFVTGGSFISANRARMPQLRMFLAENNFVVGSINYRTAPNSKFPAPIEDLKSAIRFLKASAQNFNVDAEKVFVIGDSAGGYLTAFAAVTNGDKIFNVGANLNYSSKILAAVDLYGISDLARIAENFPENIQAAYNMPGAMASIFVNGIPVFTGTGGGILENPEMAARANPINYITKNSAPMLLMHGTADNIVSPAQTDLIFQVLRNVGVEAERYIVPNANHSDDYWAQEEIFRVILDFLKKYI